MFLSISNLKYYHALDSLRLSLYLIAKPFYYFSLFYTKSTFLYSLNSHFLMAYFVFRVEDMNLSSLSDDERNQINSFQTFIMQKPNGYCSFCMKLLYPEDQKYRKVQFPLDLPCLQWKLRPITKQQKNEDYYMVCARHWKMDETKILRFAYPGEIDLFLDLKGIQSNLDLFL